MPSIYKPLSKSDPSEIRLVKIYPGEFDQVPRCELSHASLKSGANGSTREPYTSLSYTWGDPKGTSSIRLNGTDHAVTHNLYSFLQHMQTILFRIAPSLPPLFLNNAFMRHMLLQRIITDPHFPRDMPSTAKRVLDLFVRRHICELLEEMEVDAAKVDAVYLDASPADPAQCFLHFWIDALCINQQDLEEKSVQVARMREIYEHAPSMVIWLDDHADPMPQAAEAMDLLYDIYKELEPWLEGREDHEQATRRVTADGFLTPRVDRFEHLRALFEREWFFRSWIIQEVAVTKVTQVVFVGFRSIPWRQLSILLPDAGEQMLGYKFDYHLQRVGFRMSIQQLKDLIDVVKVSRDLRQTGAAGRNAAGNLQRLLRAIKGNFAATNPRDLLYALLGLLGSGPVPAELLPDYSAPLGEVYHKYEVYMIKNTGSFGLGACFEKDLEGVPSWVTDWRTYHCPDIEDDWGSAKLQHIEVSDDGRRLIADGVRLGAVVAVFYTRSFTIGDDGSSLHRRTREQEFEDVDLGESIEEVRTLRRVCLEHLPRTSPDVTPEDFQKRWERFWPAYDDPRLRAQVEMIEGTREFDEEQFLSSIGGPWFAVFSGKVRSALWSGVGITSDGQLVASWRKDDRIKGGDVVWALKGADMPCLLRPVGSEYSMVGQLSLTSFKPSECMEGATQVERVTII
jgi:hypothetical protein